MKQQKKACNHAPENEFSLFVSKILDKGFTRGTGGGPPSHCGVHSNG